MQEPHGTVDSQTESVSLTYPKTVLNLRPLKQQAFESPVARFGPVEEELLFGSQVFEWRVPLR